MLSIQVDYNAGIDKIHDFMPEKLTILKFPDPRLRTVAEKVTKFDKSLEKLSDDMLHTMYEGNGIGLAATQVNKHIRLIVMDLSEERNKPRVFINPEYEILDNESLSSFEEGCLSVPGFSEEIIRPDINECFADFKTKGEKFYYALGGIKAVGYEAISNIVDERLKNGNFKSISDFLNRVNPKDINKLQLEGLVKAGAFDQINLNRQSLFNSIPNLITKSKNIFENKSANQIDLFGENINQENEIISNIEDWIFEERLSKELSLIHI